jgi:hypothetical protein
MVQLGEDGKVKWNKLHYPHGDIGNSMQEGMSQRSGKTWILLTNCSSILWQHCGLDCYRGAVFILPEQLRRHARHCSAVHFQEEYVTLSRSMCIY